LEEDRAVGRTERRTRKEAGLLRVRMVVVARYVQAKIRNECDVRRKVLLGYSTSKFRATVHIKFRGRTIEPCVLHRGSVQVNKMTPFNGSDVSLTSDPESLNTSILHDFLLVRT
jgi:hypothetical protein